MSIPLANILLDYFFKGGPIMWPILLALAAALVTILAARIVEHIGEAFARRDDLLASLLGAGVGLCFGLSYAVLFQSVRPEVYTLHTTLILGATCALERFEATKSRRFLFLAALAIGLALSNHHFLTLLFGPAIIVLLVWRRPAPRSSRRWIGSGTTFCLSCFRRPSPPSARVG